MQNAGKIFDNKKGKIYRVVEYVVITIYSYSYNVLRIPSTCKNIFSRRSEREGVFG